MYYTNVYMIHDTRAVMTYQVRVTKNAHTRAKPAYREPYPIVWSTTLKPPLQHARREATRALLTHPSGPIGTYR